VISALGVERQRRDDRATRYLVYRGALAKLERRAGRLEARLGAVERALARQQTIVAEANAAVRCMNENLQAAVIEKAAIVTATEELERRKWRAEAEVNALTGTLVENRERVRGLQFQIGQLESPLKTASGQLSAMRRQEETRGRALHDLREQLAVAMGVREDTNRQLAAAALVESRESQAYAGLLREVDRLRFEERHALEELRTLENEKCRLTEEIEGARETVARLMEILGEQTERIGTIELERPGVPGRASNLPDARRRLSAALLAHERAMVRLEQRILERDRLAEEIERELNTAPSTLQQSDGDIPADDEIRRLRSRANQFADADESVVREFAEIEERYSHLSRHLDDLQTATVELQNIMDMADREMAQRFSVAFDAVNKEFSRMFRVMLQGGDARLEQVDPEGGIGIRAQLPGKRAQSSSAFSGGERALVASSLLFGVLNIRPTPFCVLDEVDAPLDESNVDRYLAALRDISTRTQVVVVTHNRATMAAADVLYGVTMDDEGVTSLLSLRLDSYEVAG
jgi:chromosome segregation protein